jgi:hypothetical protein
MDLSNMRQNGVRSLDVTCLDWYGIISVGHTNRVAARCAVSISGKFAGASSSKSPNGDLRQNRLADFLTIISG